MPEIIDTRERRIRQFEHYLALMEHRARRVVKSRCFLIFAVPMERAIRPRLGGLDERIVQFAFSDHSYFLDLPDTTVTPEEAKIVAARPGFGFALDQGEKGAGELRFDPVQRHYPYVEHRTAAEDTAYVFFDLWRTPVDVFIKVTAAPFEGRRRWERGFSMG